MMSKLEYLRVMESILKVRLTQKEVDEIMRDYAEYFVEGTRQGKSDYEIAFNLGDPREVASQIIAETLGGRADGYSSGTGATTKPPKVPVWKRMGTAVHSMADGMGKAGGCLFKLFLICMGLFLLPFAFGGLLLALGMIAGILTALFGWIAAMGAFVLAAVVCFVSVFFFIGSVPMSGIAAALFICLGVIAGGVLGVTLGMMLIRAIWKATIWCGWHLYSFITKKPIPKPIPRPVTRPRKYTAPQESFLQEEPAAQQASMEEAAPVAEPTPVEEKADYYQVNIPEEKLDEDIEIEDFAAPTLEMAEPEDEMIEEVLFQEELDDQPEERDVQDDYEEKGENHHA